jgi:hypothetical protein
MSLDSSVWDIWVINLTWVNYNNSSIIWSTVDEVKWYLSVVLWAHCHTDNSSWLSYYELWFLKSNNWVIELSTLNLWIWKILHYYDDGVIIWDSWIARVDFNTLERKKINFSRIFWNIQEKIEYRTDGECKKIIIGQITYYITPDLHITTEND